MSSYRVMNLTLKNGEVVDKLEKLQVNVYC